MRQSKLTIAAYRGAEGIDLYIKCVQLIMRHQLRFLIQRKGLPVELETVAQDLWTLRILHLGDKIRNDNQDLETPQTFSTQGSETETEEDPFVISSRKHKIQECPTLVDCLALCYLAMVTLRLPVTPGNIYTWVTEEEMPYLNAIRLLPPLMRSRLPSTYHSALSPYSLLNLRRFYTSVADIQFGLEQEFSIVWPPLNVPSLLLQYLKGLALPLELYDATIRLGEYLGYDFTLQATSRQKLSIADLPEARLMACLAVCVKLMYPLDDREQDSGPLVEPATTAMHWPTWCRAMQQGSSDEAGRYQYTIERLMKVTEDDIFSMSSNELDDYLDFYLGSFLDKGYFDEKGADKDFQLALYRMFPTALNADVQTRAALNDQQHDEQLGPVKLVHRAITEARSGVSIEERTSGKQGTNYVEYWEESDLPELACLFFDKAARIAGLTMDMLVRCTRHIERKLARQQYRMKGVGSQVLVGKPSEMELDPMTHAHEYK